MPHNRRSGEKRPERLRRVAKFERGKRLMGRPVGRWLALGFTLAVAMCVLAALGLLAIQMGFWPQ